MDYNRWGRLKPDDGRLRAHIFHSWFERRVPEMPASAVCEAANPGCEVPSGPLSSPLASGATTRAVPKEPPGKAAAGRIAYCHILFDPGDHPASVWGSQSWLQPAFSRPVRASLGWQAEACPTDAAQPSGMGKLQSRLSAGLRRLASRMSRLERRLQTGLPAPLGRPLVP